MGKHAGPNSDNWLWWLVFAIVVGFGIWLFWSLKAHGLI